MSYLIWQCPKCKDIVVSNSFRHHEMDYCKCGETSVDLEEYICSFCGFPIKLAELDYNFWQEIAASMKSQDLLEYITFDNKIFITFDCEREIRRLEDEILKELVKEYEKTN